MLVAQLTDLHFLAPGALLAGRYDLNPMAERAIDHVRSLVPVPDVVIVTGDVTSDGDEDAYAIAREALDGLDVAWYAIPGNHDCRDPFATALRGHLDRTAGGFIQFVVDGFDVRLVGLDTLRPGHDDGELCDERLAWLDETLAAAPGRPTLVFMHHPPFETGIEWIDRPGLSGASVLREILARYPQVELLACGHVHRAIATRWAGTLVTLPPAAVFQVALNLAPGAPPKLAWEPPAVHVHRWDGGAFVTHLSYVDCYEVIEPGRAP
jgi:3',5'-cyclic AMP phosphodiesterase CpdA